MNIKRPFAKKTANMKEGNAKKWAENLKNACEILIDHAKILREMKDLLKKWESAKDDKKKKIEKEITIVWKKAYYIFGEVDEKLGDCLNLDLDISNDVDEAIKGTLERKLYGKK